MKFNADGIIRRSKIPGFPQRKSEKIKTLTISIQKNIFGHDNYFFVLVLIETNMYTV